MRVYLCSYAVIRFGLVLKVECQRKHKGKYTLIKVHEKKRNLCVDKSFQNLWKNMDAATCDTTIETVIFVGMKICRLP